MAENPRSEGASPPNTDGSGPRSDSNAHLTENIIRPARQRRAAPAETRETDDAAKNRPGSRTRRSASAPRPVPEHVRKLFVQVGQRYYFRDGAHAFSDRGSRLITTSENTEVVRSLIV